MNDAVKDLAMREALFQHIDSLVSRYGSSLPTHVLQQRFSFEEFSFRPLQATGIFKPGLLGSDGAAVILLSSVDGPYSDRHDLESGFLQYKYQGGIGQEENRYNRSLRMAYEKQRPLLYLCGTGDNQYLPLYPSYVIQDHRDQGFVEVAVADRTLTVPPGSGDKIQTAIRAYSTILAKRRIHQSAFRSIVMRAYHSTCAMCNLKIDRLLDAAHVIPDNAPNGDPIIQNGISLCKIHHQAFDWNIVGVTPGYEIQVSEKTLKMIDGPMLTHGIQGLHGKQLILPRKKHEHPDPDRLKIRYEAFVNV